MDMSSSSSDEDDDEQDRYYDPLDSVFFVPKPPSLEEGCKGLGSKLQAYVRLLRQYTKVRRQESGACDQSKAFCKRVLGLPF